MELSARNQLRGTVKSVTLGSVMAEVVVDLNGQEVVSAITRGSAERLGPRRGHSGHRGHQGHRGPAGHGLSRRATRQRRRAEASIHGGV
jgi:molybdopterin-binding protein